MADETLSLDEMKTLKLAVAAGWEEGLVVPIPRGGRRLGLVSLLRTTGAFSRDEKSLLTLLSVYFHEHVRALSTPLSFAAAPSGIAARVVECLQLAAAGYSDKAIGAKLNISPSTAHEYMENAKQRLSAKTRAEAVAVAISLGLIKL